MRASRIGRTGSWKARSWMLGAAVFALGAAFAEPALPGEGDDWDHRQMRSRYQPRVDTKTVRRGIEGETRFGQLRRGAATEAPTHVPSELEHVSQRAWEGRSGGPSQDTSLFPPGASHRVGAIGRKKSEGSRSSSGRSSRSGRMN